MKTYTEQEVDTLLKEQRQNCLTSFEELGVIHINKNIIRAIRQAFEPVNWRNKKRFFIVFDNTYIFDLSAVPVDDLTDWVEKLKDISFLPLAHSSKNPAEKLKTEISKETAEFLKQNCNIERNNYGEDTYILNNLRFKIIEE